MAAVIWTDVVQMVIYIGGTLVALLTSARTCTAAGPQIHSVAAAAGKFHMFNFVLNLTTTYTFWAGVLGGTFLTMASHGTDQLMVQRLLAARNLRESRAALLCSGVVIFLQFCALPAHRRRPLRLLSAASGHNVPQRRPHLPHIHRQ